MACGRGCGKARGVIRPSPAAPVPISPRVYDSGVVVVRSSGVFSELVLTSVVRDLPNKEFIVLGGIPEVWEQFHNARATEDLGEDSSILWNPLTPAAARAMGHDIFQIAADRFRDVGLVVDRGPSVCHLPVSPDPGLGTPEGVLFDLSGSPGTVDCLPVDIMEKVMGQLAAHRVKISRLSAPFSYPEALRAVVSSKVVVCPHGPVHLMSCGAHFPLQPEPERKTLLLSGGAWPSWAVPGCRQVRIESWHCVPCSSGGCGAFFAGPGPKSSDRCVNCSTGAPECMLHLSAEEIVSKVLLLLSL